jgi:hypothetical protein
MPRGKATKTLALRAQAIEVLAHIRPATVRAVCYKLFVLGAIPDMSKNSTNRVSRILVAAREDGLVPWSWIVDETREVECLASWRDPDEYAAAVLRSYRRDRWQFQPRRVEVWFEKGTVRGTLAPVLDTLGAPFRVLHGYSSATTLYEVAVATRDLPQPLLALYCGDWDPSGLHMSEVDLPGRLAQYGARVELVRVALTADDVYRDPNPNPTHPDRAPRGDLPGFPAGDKRRDPRYRWYVDRYGSLCWELDALDPNRLRERVAAAIGAVIDWDAWDACGRVEDAELGSLRQVLAAWHGRVA